MSDYAGQQFGNYRLAKLLGRGGFAEVYEGEHVYLQTRVAIKILHARLADNERAGFLNEAQTIARLQHDHIVRVLEFDVRDDTPFLVMEYAQGGTLREHFLRGKAMPLEQVVPVVQQVAAALQYAHEQRLVHRDVKPENMLRGPENEVLLSDFGIALLLQSTHKSRAHEVVGTVAYMAPEQLRGQAQPASDQYALAIAVYEWLCGERPFQGTSFASIASQHLLNAPPPLRSKAPHLPPSVEAVVHKALAKDPEQRFPSVRDFAVALNDAARDPTTSVLDISSTSTPSPATTVTGEIARGRTQSKTPEPIASISMTQPASQQPTLTMTQPAKLGRRGVSRLMAVLLGALALLLVLGGVIIHFSFSQTPTTSGAPKNLSSTSVQNQKVKDYQKLYLQATSGSPVIDDPLNAPNSLGWLVDEKCHFSGGALHLQSGPVVCSATNFEASDFAYQVQVTINAGKRVGNSVPGAGIVFRFNPIGTYYLEVGADGSCELGALKTSPGKTPLVLLHTCPALHTGYHQKNLLTAIMRGPDIYVYINKQFVGTSSDGTYGSGLVGVFAVGTASDAAFQNAQIWNLR